MIRSANGRYLEALVVVDDDSAARKLLDRVTRPAKRNDRRRRGLQPLSPADQQVLLAVMRGQHRLRRFRSGDLASICIRAIQTRVGVAARVTRVIQRLRAHGLADKILRDVAGSRSKVSV